MSCCPPAPSLVDASSADAQQAQVQDTQILPGESVECYMRRTENPTGLKDDLTGYVPYKILTTSIPINADATINTTLELTPLEGGKAATAVTWSMSPTISWLEITGATIRSAGGNPVPEADRGRPVSIQVTVDGTKDAVDGGGPFTDVRTFNISATAASANNAIQFISPLPGGRVTSKFNPNRVHPVRGTVSPHKGVDMSTPGSTTGDVVAAADGDVVFAGFQAGGAGNYIKINHRNSAGRLMCQTVYMHLERFYVAVGQRVAAGQKIGREGNTGIGTAAHLHFECRLLENGQQTWIDPLPLIRDALDVATSTAPDNTGVGFVPRPASDARLTTAEVSARGSGCQAFGPDYGQPPGSPPVTPPSLPPGPATVFDRAWFFTMTYEVGPHWQTTPQFSPGDPDLDAGLFGTTFQRQQVGYKSFPALVGGETKFGIAQGPNPNISVAAVDYTGAKAVGYENYWQKGPNTYEAGRPRTAIMLFDMYYLHGGGNARHILNGAAITGLDDVQSCNALHQSQLRFISAIVASNAARKKFENGWINRSKALLNFALTTTL